MTFGSADTEHSALFFDSVNTDFPWRLRRLPTQNQSSGIDVKQSGSETCWRSCRTVMQRDDADGSLKISGDACVSSFHSIKLIQLDA